VTTEAKSIDAPDDKRTFEHGTLNTVNLAGATLARATFEPGWRWSNNVKPLVGTESCQASHVSYVISGRLAVRMDDGQEVQLGPGDAAVVSPGHDAWVVGDEPYVSIDFAATGSTLAGRAVRCPCGVEFRIARDDQTDHLVAAVQQHASGSHGHDVTREHVLAELGQAGT
jgi:quercetin dioxygenase-like cupin family protein